MGKDEAIRVLEGCPNTKQVIVEALSPNGHFRWRVKSFPRILIKEIKADNPNQYIITT